jgi:hypothetical protein
MPGEIDAALTGKMAQIWLEEMGRTPDRDLMDMLIRIRADCDLPKGAVESVLIVGNSPSTTLWDRQVARDWSL